MKFGLFFDNAHQMVEVVTCPNAALAECMALLHAFLQRVLMPPCRAERTNPPEPYLNTFNSVF